MGRPAAEKVRGFEQLDKQQRSQKEEAQGPPPMSNDSIKSVIRHRRSGLLDLRPQTPLLTLSVPQTIQSRSRFRTALGTIESFAARSSPAAG
jgi:hypothetical protein